MKKNSAGVVCVFLVSDENSKKWKKKHVFEIFTCKLTVKRAIIQKVEKTRKKGQKNHIAFFKKARTAYTFVKWNLTHLFQKWKRFWSISKKFYSVFWKNVQNGRKKVKKADWVFASFWPPQKESRLN